MATGSRTATGAVAASAITRSTVCDLEQLGTTTIVFGTAVAEAADLNLVRTVGDNHAAGYKIITCFDFIGTVWGQPQS